MVNKGTEFPHPKIPGTVTKLLPPIKTGTRKTQEMSFSPQTHTGTSQILWSPHFWTKPPNLPPVPHEGNAQCKVSAREVNKISRKRDETCLKGRVLGVWVLLSRTQLGMPVSLQGIPHPDTVPLMRSLEPYGKPPVPTELSPCRGVRYNCPPSPPAVTSSQVTTTSW